MSELFDKEMNAQKEFEKNFRDPRKLPHAHEKVCDENERNKQEKKNDGRLKYFCGQEGVYNTRAESSCNGYQPTSAQRFLIH